MNLALLAYEMRAAGIKSLALELSEPGGPPIATFERETLAPDAPVGADLPAKAEDECSVPGCTSKRAGLFGGIAGDKCRTHALQLAGVRT